MTPGCESGAPHPGVRAPTVSKDSRTRRPVTACAIGRMGRLTTTLGGPMRAYPAECLAR